MLIGAPANALEVHSLYGRTKADSNECITIASERVTAALEKTQLAAGRWAMGVTGHKVASEFIMGEMGWSTFEAREAVSKIRYFARIGAIVEHRWPRMVQSMMASEKVPKQ